MPSSDVGATDPTLMALESASGAAPAPTLVAGRYEIVALLGAGGMGRVYRALDRELSELVALKMLHRDLVQSEEMVQRFRQEVRLARKVTHRNVARTFDIGEHGGEKFLTMELIAGEALSARLERAVLSLTDTLTIAREVLAGMGAAHAAGVVHRDLKPDNVLIEVGGRVVITDFGIARSDAPGSASKTAGLVIGTPAYMAPEQVSGILALDARADIYAFGVMLYEMLTGRRAWPGDSALSVATARLVQPPPDPRLVRPALPAGLAEVVLRCMARERDARYASCEEVDRALAALAIGGGSAATLALSVAPQAEQAPPPVGESRDRAVAVVHFRNFGPPEEAYFVEGLTEDLVDTLATVNGLRVRGPVSVESTDRDVVDTGRRLGVDVVVDGSVRRAGDMLRVSARLVGVADGFQIWSSRFDRAAGGAFALNDEVAQAIAAALAAKPSEAARPQPTDPLAIEVYFRAKYALGRFWANGGQSEAAKLFREALARAPDNPTILGGYVHAQIGRNLFEPLPVDEARMLVKRALLAGGRVADPWVGLAAFRFNHTDDPSGAIRALRQALELAPSSSDAHDLAGRLLMEADVWEVALSHLDRALWLDPLQRWSRADRMRAAALTGDWERAAEFYESGVGSAWLGQRALHAARLWSWSGAPELASYSVPADVSPRFREIIERYLRSREHRRGGAPLLADEIRDASVNIAGNPPQRSRSRRYFAQIGTEQAAICGYNELALELLALSVEAGLLDLGWLNRLNVLDPLRGDARFEALRVIVQERAAGVRAAWHGPPESLDAALVSLT